MRKETRQREQEAYERAYKESVETIEMLFKEAYP